MEQDEVFDIEQMLRTETDLGKVISVLQNGRLTPQPDTDEYIKAINPTLHDVMLPEKRPDKQINIDPSSENYGATTNIMTNAEDDAFRQKTKIERVARIALAFQKLIVKRAVGITFGNPVKYKAAPANEHEQALYDALMRVLDDNKEQTLNRKAAREVYGMTEVAERWYVTEGKEMHYNYSQTGTTSKIRCVTFSPMFGDKLFPYFDENRDMKAFSRQFTKKDASGNKRAYFETYTAESFYMWENSGDANSAFTGWVMCPGYPKPNPYGKIPIIYGCQPQTEYEDVQSIIDRMEKMLSNFADTNDYHGSPKIVVKGHVNSFCQKGEAGAILELDPDADANYLEWSHAPEAIKTEYETLKELVHTITQTPDISWASVRGMNVSGVALELMFMDAILKVKDKEEIWMDYLPRRINLLKSMMAVIDIKLRNAANTLQIQPEIEPYIVIDKQSRANIELALSGNKQLKSRKTAMIDLGMKNVETEIEAIDEEEQQSNYFGQGEPTMA